MNVYSVCLLMFPIHSTHRPRSQQIYAQTDAARNQPHSAVGCKYLLIRLRQHGGDGNVVGNNSGSIG